MKWETGRPLPERANGWLWAVLSALLISCYYCAIAPMFLGHRDLGWHIAAGNLIRATGSIPSQDTWSFTAGAQHWYNLSWGWDVLASLLYRQGGLGALVMLTFLLGAAIAILLTRIAHYHGASLAASLLAAVCACACYPTFAPPDIFLAAAPQIVTLLFSVLFYAICLDGRRLWLLPLLMLPWANLHNGCITGFAVIGVFGASALWQKQFDLFRRYLVTGLACLCAMMINPQGIGLLHGVLLTLHHPASEHISEWQPLLRELSLPASLPAVAYILFFIFIDLMNKRDVPLPMRLLSWMWLMLGFKSTRFLVLFFLFSAPLLAIGLDRRYPLFPRLHMSRIRAGFVAAALLLALPFLYQKAFPIGATWPDIYYPGEEITYLEQHLPKARLLNHWNFGGYIIFATHGAIPVFIDGRSSTAYPDEVIAEYNGLLEGPQMHEHWEKLLEKYQIDAVLWPKPLTQASEFFIGNPRWKLVYSGPVATLYAKEHE